MQSVGFNAHAAITAFNRKSIPYSDLDTRISTRGLTASTSNLGIPTQMSGVIVHQQAR